jgi:hypothetical protein
MGAEMANASKAFNSKNTFQNLADRVHNHLVSSLESMSAGELQVSERAGQLIDVSRETDPLKILTVRLIEKKDHVVVMGYIPAVDGFIALVHELEVARDVNRICARIIEKLYAC